MIQRINSLFLMAIALLVLLSGCKKTPVEALDKPSIARFSLVKANTPATAGAVGRAVAGDEFLHSSMIGIFASEAAMTDLSTPTNSNVGYSNPEGKSIWSFVAAGEPIYFLENDAPMNFYSYHPFSGQENSSTVVNGNVATYTTPTDQSSEEKLKLADLMWGNALDKSQKGGTVNLVFEHKLAKMALKIKKGGDWGSESVSISEVSISGANIFSSASLSLSDGKLTPIQNTNGAVHTITSTLEAPQSLGLTNDYECEFIFVPCNANSMILSFKVGDGSVAYQTTLNSSLEFTSGTQLNIGILINKLTPISVSLSPTIESWNFTSHINVEGI